MQKSVPLSGIAAILYLHLLAFFVVCPPTLKAATNSGEFSKEDAVSCNMVAAAQENALKGHIRATYIADLPDRMVFFKIEQGLTFGRILDQRMSNLHYSGPGGMLAFSRKVVHADRISEIGFGRASFHYAKPAHDGTIVYNPGLGFRYMQLRKMGVDARPDFYFGIKADLFGNARIAPALGNSFLYADIAFALQPKLRIEYPVFFLNRDWQFDGMLSFALFGYGMRIPEYATSFQVSEDGGSVLTRASSTGLHPGNFAHVNTGIFLREPIGGDHNPNWLRIGYVWDYYRISGDHDLNTFHASHQLMLELHFMMN